MTTTDISLDGPINLVARTGHGSLTVRTEDDLTTAIVSLEARDGRSDVVARTTVVMRGRTLVVATPRRGGVFDLPLFGGANRSRDAVDITVTVPSATPMKLSSSTAAIAVLGRAGSTDVASGAGDVDVAHVQGDLRLRLGAVSARIGTVTGSVSARSGSGTASISSIGGDLHVTTGSGSLQVGHVDGTVHSRSGSGSAVLSSVHGDVDLASGSGDVAIGLPAGQSTRLDIVAGSGNAESELPVADGPADTARSVSIRARTGSGNIRLFRAS